MVDILVRSDVIEAAGVFLHDAIVMAFAQDDKVVQTFAPETAPEALADSIGLRPAIGSAEIVNGS